MKSRPSSRTGVRIAIFAKPRAKTSRIVQAEGLAVSVALAAPPSDGAANDELIAVLAKALDVPKSALQLVLGGASRRKMVIAAGLAEQTVAERLAHAVDADRRR